MANETTKRTRLTDEDVLRLRREIITYLIGEGCSDKQISEVFNMDRSWVFRIRKGMAPRE